MTPKEKEMWNVVVQYLFHEHNFTLADAIKSANNLRDNDGLEKAYQMAQTY